MADHNPEGKQEPDLASARECLPLTPAEMMALGADFVTLWHSEIAAIAADRETRETWQTLAMIWSAAASSMLHAGLRATTEADRAYATHGHADAAPPAGAAGTQGEAGAPAAVAAPDAGGDEIGRLARRVAELEQRLDAARPRPRKPRQRQADT